jgi:uncharacterized protein YndB with AHSA1/START domain
MITGPASLHVSTPGDREIVVTRSFAAPRALVFDAHTKPELVRLWLLGPPGWTMPVCDIDFRVGGRYRYEWEDRDGQTLGMGGSYHSIVVPERVVFDERFDGDPTPGDTIDTMVLTEHTGTIVTTTLTLTVRYQTAERRDAMLSSGMTTGMEAGFQRLDALAAEITAGGVSEPSTA